MVILIGKYGKNEFNTDGEELKIKKGTVASQIVINGSKIGTSNNIKKIGKNQYKEVLGNGVEIIYTYINEGQDVEIDYKYIEPDIKRKKSEKDKVDNTNKNESKKDDEKIKIISRKEWGAFSPKKELEKDSNYFNITIHHSGNSGISDIKKIQEKEMEKGFDDIGYHFAIDKEGEIYEARQIEYKGSHVLNNNTGRIGILVMGDFEPQNTKSVEDFFDFSCDTPSTNQLHSLKKLINYLKSKYMTIKTLGGHKDYKMKTQCPGEVLYSELNNIRKACNLKGP